MKALLGVAEQASPGSITPKHNGHSQLCDPLLVANLGRRPDGSFAALDAAPLYEWGKAAGSIYQEELRRRLTERLGVEWGVDRNGCREIEGFTSEWLRTFSKPTVAIEEHLAGAGPEHPDPATRMRADNAASLATRPAKDPSLTPEVLRQRWQDEADQVGLPTGYALEAQVADRALVSAPLGWDDLVDALVDPEEGLCSHRARFGEAHVVERVAAFGAGRLDVDAIEGLTVEFLKSGEAVRLVDRTGRRSPQYSTVDHLALEDQVLHLLDQLATTRVAGIDDALVEAAIAAEQPGLGPDQADAARALCAPGPVIRSVIAPAGFGKTTMVHAVGEHLGWLDTGGGIEGSEAVLDLVLTGARPWSVVTVGERQIDDEGRPGGRGDRLRRLTRPGERAGDDGCEGNVDEQIAEDGRLGPAGVVERRVESPAQDTLSLRGVRPCRTR